MGVDLSDLIRGLRAQVLEQTDWDAVLDEGAVRTVREKRSLDRVTAIHKWLQWYGVFQGLTGEQRLTVTTAALDWADRREAETPLDSPESIAFAHEQLEASCSAAYGCNRSFLSLASKVLWLCSPDTVPIFDTYARNAIYFFSKLDHEIPRIEKEWSPYRKYVTVWLFLYEKYRNPIEEIQSAECPHRVRVFDRVLWVLGKPGYGTHER